MNLVSYLVIGEDENYKKNDEINTAYATGKYKGIAYVKYVD